MAESSVNTFKRDYISMTKTAAVGHTMVVDGCRLTGFRRSVLAMLTA